MSPTLYQIDLRITNHRRQNFPASTLLSFIQNYNQMAHRLTAATSFPRLLFYLLQFSRQRPSFSAHRVALMTKTDLTFPAFSLRFVDFTDQFCFCWKFLFQRVVTLEFKFDSGVIFWTNHNSLVQKIAGEEPRKSHATLICKMRVAKI